MKIFLENISKSYIRQSEKLTVLDHLNCEFLSGSTTSVVGPSGSGKTSLLSLMAGLDDPDSGFVKIGDNNITLLNEEERTKIRSRTIGIIFQKFHLIPSLTAIENVALPLEINHEVHAFDRAAEALNQVGLAHRSQHLPAEMSGGECQRVAIARALVHRPAIILADEPSGNLDTSTGDSVMDLLFEICSQSRTTLVLVTHNERHAARCSRILRLNAGRFVT